VGFVLHLLTLRFSGNLFILYHEDLLQLIPSSLVVTNWNVGAGTAPQILAHLWLKSGSVYLHQLFALHSATQNVSVYVCRYVICHYPADIYAHLFLSVTENLVLSALNAILVKNIASCCKKHCVYNTAYESQDWKKSQS